MSGKMSKVKDTIDTLGAVLPNNHTQGRDAVHIAVMPVVAGCDHLRPGERLKIRLGTDNVVLMCYDESDKEYIGIVDPFISIYPLKKGDKFWMWLRPGTISGLRHEWTHSKIDSKKPYSLAEVWLQEFACKWNFDYDTMIAEAQNYGGDITARGIDLCGRNELDHGDYEKFWECIEALTGKKFGDDHRESFGWRCSC